MAYQDRSCFVLKSVNYKDADKIFILYSDKDGKFSAIARGVRKISSKRSGSLDRLNLVRLSYYQAPSGYKTITEVKNVSSFRHIKEDPQLVEIAYRIVWLFLREIEEEAPDARLFKVLHRTLQLLDSQTVAPSIAYAHFLLNFMQALGYSLSLDACVFCGRPLDKSWDHAGFNLEKGGIVCADCKGFESTLSLPTAALLSKAKNLREKNFKFYQKERKEHRHLQSLLVQYVDFKLGR